MRETEKKDHKLPQGVRSNEKAGGFLGENCECKFQNNSIFGFKFPSTSFAFETTKFTSGVTLRLAIA